MGLINPFSNKKILQREGIGDGDKAEKSKQSCESGRAKKSLVNKLGLEGAKMSA